MQQEVERAKVGQMPLTDTGAIYTAGQQLVAPSIIPGVPNWALLGGGAAVILWLILRK